MNLHTALAHQHGTSRPAIVESLKRQFPGMCPARVDDAVQAAFLEALVHAGTFQGALDRDGTCGLERMLRKTAWRQLRGQWRRKGYSAQGLDTTPVAAAASTPEDRAAAREALHDLAGLLDEAADRFGGSRPESLQHALALQLSSGRSDTEVARLAGTRREYVNRARNWMKRSLAA